MRGRQRIPLSPALCPDASLASLVKTYEINFRPQWIAMTSPTGNLCVCIVDFWGGVGDMYLTRCLPDRCLQPSGKTGPRDGEEEAPESLKQRMQTWMWCNNFTWTAVKTSVIISVAATCRKVSANGGRDEKELRRRRRKEKLTDRITSRVTQSNQPLRVSLDLWSQPASVSLLMYLTYLSQPLIQWHAASRQTWRITFSQTTEWQERRERRERVSFQYSQLYILLNGPVRGTVVQDRGL